MAQGRITKEALDRLSPTGTEYCLWDDRIAGFGVKVTPRGERSYILQYRPRGLSKTRRVTIGRYPGGPTPAEARREAETLRDLVRKGADPMEDKKARKREAVDLAFDRYAERFLGHYGERNWSTVTLRDNTRYLTAKGSPVREVLGSKPLPQISRAMIAEVFDQVPAAKRGYARNLYAVLRRLFAWAVERGDLDRSPMDGFKGPKPVASRDRVLSDEELRLAWLASQKLEYPFGPFYRLVILTGQRREEVASMEWKRLNRKAREWQLTAAETKNDRAHVVPLSDAVIAELDALAGTAADGEEPSWPSKGLVLTTNGKTAVSGFSKAKAALDAKMAEIASEGAEVLVQLEPWRVHDLRRTFATGMQRLGIRFEVTEAALNHVSGARSGVAGVYQRHDWRDEKVAAFAAWAGHLLALLNPAHRTDNVVSISAIN